jgi:hypothetical protein
VLYFRWEKSVPASVGFECNRHWKSVRVADQECRERRAIIYRNLRSLAAVSRGCFNAVIETAPENDWTEWLPRQIGGALLCSTIL